jgi:transketolase
LSDAGIIDTHRFSGRQLHYGVREHGMGAILNGLSVSNLLPFGGTFFVFSDYMRGAVRVAALSGYKVAFVWSHDSIGLGEDGPTHQPIEQLASLRAMPGLRVIRPCDANEVAQAWKIHIDGNGPTAIVLTRQSLPVLDGTAERAGEGVGRGAYTLVDASAAEPGLVLIGTGSEVQLCAGAAPRLEALGIPTRVVSMPCWELFEELTGEEQAEILPPGTPTLAVEAAATFGWERYADEAVGIDRFGASAPGQVAMEKLGFTVDNVVERATALLGFGGA